MEIHVARDGSALGVYSPDEVRSGLADGRFRASDLAWRAGMAAWTPLAEWPEFASVPSAAPTASVSPAGAEWEARLSLGSLFRGMVATVLAPSVFAGARLGFGQSLGAAYLAILVGLVPFTGLVLLNQQVEPLQMEVLAEVAESFNPAFAEGFRDGFREQQGGEQPGAGIMACVSVCMLSVLPLLVALLGLLQWCFYRLLGVKVSVERVASGGVLVATWMGVVLLPVSIVVSSLAFLSPGLSLLSGLLLQLVGLLLYARAMGHALGCGFWRALGAQLLLFLLCCACLCCLVMLAGVAGAAASA